MTTQTTEVKIVASIIAATKSLDAAEKKYQTAKQKNVACLGRLRGMNVAFADIKARLLKEARTEEYYSTDAELKQHRLEKREWIVAIDRFVDWTYRTYVQYDQPIKKEDTKERKLREKPRTLIKKEGGTLSEARLEKILEKPENIKVLEDALINIGAIVIPDGKLDEPSAEALFSHEENLELIIEKLTDMGYTVSQ